MDSDDTTRVTGTVLLLFILAPVLFFKCLPQKKSVGYKVKNAVKSAIKSESSCGAKLSSSANNGNSNNDNSSNGDDDSNTVKLLRRQVIVPTSKVTINFLYTRRKWWDGQIVHSAKWTIRRQKELRKLEEKFEERTQEVAESLDSEVPDVFVHVRVNTKDKTIVIVD